jgi:hypothetical protein
MKFIIPIFAALRVYTRSFTLHYISFVSLFFFRRGKAFPFFFSKIPSIVHKMSEGHQFLISNDGSQIMLDATTGECYILLANNHPPTNLNYRYQPANLGHHLEVNRVQTPHVSHSRYDATQSRSKYLLEKLPRQQSNKGVHQRPHKK